MKRDGSSGFRLIVLEAGIVAALLVLVAVKITSELQKENADPERPIHLTYD